MHDPAPQLSTKHCDQCMMPVMLKVAQRTCSQTKALIFPTEIPTFQAGKSRHLASFISRIEYRDIENRYPL